ncbi:hypothetical protein OAQ08_04845 [Alphaproteobacteria bacterium]|nr:hypothetical protein [Alphaproteobacteria bacterium]
MEIIKNHPPKKDYKLMTKHQDVKIIKTISTKIVDDFFKSFPEEKRGRKSFKAKEKEIMTLMAYNELIKKAISVKCDCIGNIKEILKNEKLEVSASFYKKY